MAAKLLTLNQYRFLIIVLHLRGYKTTMKKKTFRRLEILLHFLTAFIILIKAADLMARGVYYPGGILSGLAFTILIISLYWRRLDIKPRQARVTCYYLEAPALLVMAYVLHLEGNESLPHVFIISAIIYPAMGFISSKRFKRIKNHSL